MNNQSIKSNILPVVKKQSQDKNDIMKDTREMRAAYIIFCKIIH